MQHPNPTLHQEKDGVSVIIPATATLIDERSGRLTAETLSPETEEFAKMLAASLNDKELRRFVKTEVGKRFDDDYDFLLSKAALLKVGDSDFSSKLKNGFVLGRNKGEEIFRTVAQNPRLHVAVPIAFEKWDDARQLPLVAVAVGARERETNYLKAFDANGKVYLIDANKEPDLPVIVLGNNERADANGEYKRPLNLPSSGRALGHTSGVYEKITWIKCPNLDEIESWYRGRPELRFDGVVYNDNFSAAFQAFSKMEYPPARHNASNGYTLSAHTDILNLFIWNFEQNHGPDYYVQAWELDEQGTTLKLTVGVSVGQKDAVSGTASFELTYRAEDKRLAGQLLHYTNPMPTMISDGTIQYRIEN